MGRLNFCLVLLLPVFGHRLEASNRALWPVSPFLQESPGGRILLFHWPVFVLGLACYARDSRIEVCRLRGRIFAPFQIRQS